MKKISSKIYIFLVFLFLYAPIFVLIANSFNQSKSRTVWTGFTLDWYKKLFNNEVILKSLLNTLIVAAIASVISTILGTAAAIGIYKMKKIARSLIINITYIPIMNSESTRFLSQPNDINNNFINLTLTKRDDNKFRHPFFFLSHVSD